MSLSFYMLALSLPQLTRGVRWGFEASFVSCVCVSSVLFSVGVCV